MRKFAFLLAVLALASFAVPGTTEDVSIEKMKAQNPLEEAAEAVPVVMASKSSIRCDARLRFRRSGYHGRCPYGRVVTGVQLTGDIAILDCAEVQVTCRQ